MAMVLFRVSWGGECPLRAGLCMGIGHLVNVVDRAVCLVA